MDTAVDATGIADAANITRRIRTTTKQERKLQDRLNRIAKLTPGKRRIYELMRIGCDFETEADMAKETGIAVTTDMAKQLKADALFVNRLAHDLLTLRVEVRGSRYVGNSRHHWDHTCEPRP